jgi:hypothetical protein
MTDPLVIQAVFFLCCRFFFSPPFSPQPLSRYTTNCLSTDEFQGCWCVLTATLTTVNIDGAFADISLAAFGRKELQIAEVCRVSMVCLRVPKIRLIE